MTSRVVVPGAGAGGLSAANRLARHGLSGVDLQVTLVERSLDHVFAPGFVAVLFGDAEPAKYRRAVGSLALLEVEVGWHHCRPVCGDLAPWTLEGAPAGHEAIRALAAGDRVVVGPGDVAYRCPPAVIDLAVGSATWPAARPTSCIPGRCHWGPFGAAPAAAFSQMLAEVGVGFHGDFTIKSVEPGLLRSRLGASVAYDVALPIPPHRPPTVVAASPLA